MNILMEVLMRQLSGLERHRESPPLLKKIATINSGFSNVYYKNLNGVVPFRFFMVEVRGVEPRSRRPLTALSTYLADVWIFRTLAQRQAAD